MRTGHYFGKTKVPKNGEKEERSKVVEEVIEERNELTEHVISDSPSVLRLTPAEEGNGSVSIQENLIRSLTPTETISPVVDNKIGKANRRGKNTVVVSLQMPIELVNIPDEIADAGAFRNRSDVILQAVRAFPDVSRRISKLETKRSLET
jgi:hypothetical protein